jgi:hypothetical protein
MLGLREYGFTTTEHDPDRSWMVLASEHRTIKLPDGLDFFTRAYEQWPAPRWSIELDPWALAPTRQRRCSPVWNPNRPQVRTWGMGANARLWVVDDARGAAGRGLYLPCRTAMGSPTFSARYTVAMVECGGRCPIEAGAIGRLADHECSHGRLPFDRTAACGCWPQEGGAVVVLARQRIRNPRERGCPTRGARSNRRVRNCGCFVPKRGPSPTS